MKDRVLTIVSTVSLFLFVLTAAICVPIVFRPFYYMQIGPLGIENYSGFDYRTIRTAFDDLMNYLLLNTPFQTGGLHWSEAGKLHFEDCKTIFWVIIVLAIVSAVCSLVLFILHRKGKFEYRCFSGHSLSFYLAIAVFVILLAVLIWGLIDFRSLFTCFHAIFFPGKDNWRFDWDEDQIIRILPEQFFINCAVFIGVIFLSFCTGCIVRDIVRRRQSRQKKESIERELKLENNNT